MKTKFGATVLAAAFLAALVIPWTVLAGGGGGGRGGGGMSGTGGAGMSGMGGGGMSGASIRNQTQMQNNFQTRGMDQVRAQDRDRDRQQIHKLSGTGPAAATTESAVSTTGEKTKKGNAYGPGDGSGPFHPEDGTGYGAPANR